MIISIGYRVNSKRGIMFRRWATSILKRYLINGYSINEKRCTECNIKYISLEDKYNKLSKDVEQIKNYNDSVKDKVFYEGEVINSLIFLRKIMFSAKKELILVDKFMDYSIFPLIEEIKVKIILITSPTAIINKYKEADDKLIKNKSDYDITIIHRKLHGRYIIADGRVFLIDHSFNAIGRERFLFAKLVDTTKATLLKGVNIK